MSVIVYECPNCGGGLTFKSQSQKWECEFCGTSHTLEELKNQQEQADQKKNENSQDLAYGSEKSAQEMPDADKIDKEDISRHDTAMRMKRFVCPQCAGEIVADETTAASFCVYCGNAAIFPEQLSGEFRPDYILPFQKSKEEAMEAYRNITSKKPLLPSEYKKESEIEKITGVYVPFWLFDFDAKTELSAAARNVTRWSSSDYEYTKTDHYIIERTAKMRFRKVPADGSSKMEDAYMEAIEPFDITKDAIKDFSYAYLSGFIAERHDVSLEAMKPRVKDRLNVTAEQVLRNSITGYDYVDNVRAESTLFEKSVKQVLLPVWLFTSRYHGKTYRFAMNGQTGKIIGTLPVSIKRGVALFFGFSGVFYLLWMLLGIMLMIGERI